MLMRLLPLVMLVGSLGFIVVLGVRNPTSWLFGGMFAISTLGMMATGGGRGGAARTSTIDESRRDYLRYLGQMRRTVREAAAAQRASAEAAHPEPEAWPAVVAGGRLWERSTADADFGHVRIGRGAQRLATRLIPPEAGPPEGLEPVTALALRRFLMAHTVVPDLPVALSLQETATIWLEPEGAAARALARAVVAQFVLWHSPADARLAVVAAPAALAEWEWAKWLPHNAHPRLRDGAGPLRMFTPEVDDAAPLVGDRAAAGPHLLVVADGVADGMGPWAGAPSVTVLRVGAPAGRRPTPSVVRLRLTADGVERVVDGEAAGGHRRPRSAAVGAGRGPGPAAGALPACGDLRRSRRARCARVARPAGPAAGACGDRRAARAMAGCCGRPAARADRRRRARRRGLLDLKESAQGGSGPHGLCIGATGSGKSELLRTLVVGLAATHAPEALNLVLVDFKGGATFLGLAAMPHVSAVITNLADELTLVDRMADALAGEIMRRQEILRAAGNLVSVTDYAAARRARPELPPLPGAGRGGRRVLRAARPAPRADRPDGHDRPPRPLPRAAPAARFAAARRGQAARAGVAPVVPHRAAHVLGVGVAGRARRAGRAPAASHTRARRSSPRAATSSSGSGAPTCPVPQASTRRGERRRRRRGRTRSWSGRCRTGGRPPAPRRAADEGPTVLEIDHRRAGGAGRARAPGLAAAAVRAAAVGRRARPAAESRCRSPSA